MHTRTHIEAKQAARVVVRCVGAGPTLGTHRWLRFLYMHAYTTYTLTYMHRCIHTHTHVARLSSHLGAEAKQAACVVAIRPTWECIAGQ